MTSPGNVEADTTAASRPLDAASDLGTDRLWQTAVGHDLAFLMARANALSLVHMSTMLEPFGLKTRSYSVLAIAASDARPSQRELSEFLRLDPSQIVSIIDQLERAGLVKREPDPRDRRANVVVATETGRELTTRARQLVSESEARWFSVLPKQELDQLRSALHTLATSATPDSGTTA